VLFVYLVLAAQYGSWSLPFAVILIVPMCLLAATVGVRIMHQDVNILTQIGFVVLVGLAAKNAILIVEFAEERLRGGGDVVQAAVEAAKLRLRPMLMTSLALVFGVLPLAIASGPGAGSQNAIGRAVVGGALSATFLAIFFVPLFFVFVKQSLHFRRWRGSGEPQPLPAE
jgi:HAE1 family hydrophobic/amphiphilic exporter-1/multidrug efflux pump